MHKRLSATLAVITLSTALFAGCGNKQEEVIQAITETAEVTRIEENTPEATEEPEHTHSYVEEITTQATCESAGLKTLTCECGDSYTEEISATGHVYENYVSNEDATYLADGTETAKCNGCELTDTRTAEGSKLEYTYTDMSATMYAQQTVNVRNQPSTDGEKVGSLSTNQEAAVTGQCNETGWYRFNYKGATVYVSDKYMSDSKVEIQASAASDNGSGNSGGQRVPTSNYENYVWYDMGDYFFIKFGPISYKEWLAIWNADPKYNNERDNVCAILRERYPDRWAVQGGTSLGGPEFTYVVSAVGHYFNGTKEVPKWDDVTYIELY